MNDFGLRENKPNQTQSQDPTPKRVGRTKEWPDEAQLLTCGTFSANIEHKDFLQHKAVLMGKFFMPPYLSKSPVTVLLSGITGQSALDCPARCKKFEKKS